jgi:hypothetical protein
VRGRRLRGERLDRKLDELGRIHHGIVESQQHHLARCGGEQLLEDVDDLVRCGGEQLLELVDDLARCGDEQLLDIDDGDERGRLGP